MERSMQSSLLSVIDESNSKSQPLSSGFKDQDMEFSSPSVSNDVKPSSSELKKQKLPFVCTTCNQGFSRKFLLIRHMKSHLQKKPFACDLCEKPYAQNSDLQRHRRIHSKIPVMYKCDLCSHVFSRKYDLLKHKKTHAKPTPKYPCVECDESFSNKSVLLRHKHTSHKVLPKQTYSSLKDALYEKVKHFPRQNALNSLSVINLTPGEGNDKDLHIFFNSIRSDLLNELNYQMAEKNSLKWYASVQVVVSRLAHDGEMDYATPFFCSRATLEMTNDNIPLHIEEAFAKMNNSFEKFTQQGNGWMLDRILNLEVYSAKLGMY